MRLGLGIGIIPASSRPVPTTAPVNVTLPSITGIETQGQTVTADPGSWSGLPSPNYAYQWKRGVTNIGTDSPNYTLVLADVGESITVVVTATNDIGSTPATSAAITPAAALAISGTPGGATVGAAYSFTPSTAGGHAAYTYALTGTLPSGLSFNTSTGAITGTPSATETASGLDITVTDADGLTDSLGTFSIAVTSGSVADIDTVEILDDTPIDVSAVAANADGQFYGQIPDGWAARLTMPYISGASLDATKIVLLVSDPGYDTSGNAVARYRYLRGSRILRKQNQSTSTYGATPGSEPLMEDNDGSTYTVHIALKYDHTLTVALGGEKAFGAAIVYAGTTIVSCEAEAGFYGAADAGAFSGTVTNSSTRAYYDPEPAYFNTPREIVGATRTGEVAPYHRYGQQGQMAACVKVRGIDATGNATAWTTVSAPTLSTLQTLGQIAEVFAFSYSTAALNAGEICRDHVQVYPWIGDSSAVTDSEDYTGAVDPRRAMRWINDRDGSYGGSGVGTGAVAVVEVGASGGSVAGDLATADATPFPTIKDAYNALSAWNNTNKGHADAGGAIIYLNDVGGTSHSLATGLTAAAGDGQTRIMQHPSNSSTCSIAGTTSARALPDLVHFIGIDQAKSTVAIWSGSVTTLTGEGHTCIVTGGTVNLGTSGSSPWLSNTNKIYLRNVTYTGSLGNLIAGMAGSGSNAVACMLALGIVNSTTTFIKSNPYRLIGCTGIYRWSDRESANQPSNDGAIVVNNIFYKFDTLSSLGGATAYSRGCYFGQNVIEGIANVSASFAADGNSVAQDNVVLFYNSIPSNPSDVNEDMARFNFLYCDVAAAVGILKRGVQKFNLYTRTGTKLDFFSYTAEGAGRVGNMETHYRTDWMGNTMMINRVPGDATTQDGWWGGAVAAPYDTFNSGVVAFTDNQAGISAAGLGTYTRSAADADVDGRVPAGCGMLKYDLGGNLRADNSSGAYEYAA